MENVALKFFGRITKIVENFPFLLIPVWSLISSFGDSIDHVASGCLTKYCLLGLTIPVSFYQVICLHLQTGLLPLGVERGQTPLKGGQIPTVCSLVDNVEAILLSENTLVYQQSKHININNHLI